MILRNKSKKLLKITGKDKCSFLQGLITNDINKLENNKALYAVLLTPQGKFLYEFFIYNINDIFYIEIEADLYNEIKQRLLMYKLRKDVEIQDCDLNLYLLIGNSPSQIETLLTVEDPRLEGCYRIIGKDLNASDDDSTYQIWRINNKIADGEHDMIKEKSFPLEYGLDHLNAIDFNKGCYVGQELTARTKHRGVVRKAIYKITSEQSLPVKGTELFAGNEKIGVVTSVHGNIGLALLRSEDYERNKDKEIKASEVVISKIEA